MFHKICWNITRANITFYPFAPFRRLYQTHYEVLNLPSNCTAQQIKDAFIKLSKEHHPDVNKSKNSHAKFLQINEAYRVLGKKDRRRNYDLGLAYSNGPRHDDTFSSYSHSQFWANRNKSQDEFYRNTAYYGINGVKKVSNGVIVMLCAVISFVGIGLQYLAILKSVTFRRQELIRKSLENEKILKDLTETASNNGNNEQIEALRIKLQANKR